MRKIIFFMACLSGLSVELFAQPLALSFEGVVSRQAFGGVWGQKVGVVALGRKSDGTRLGEATGSVVVSTNGYLNVTLTFKDGSKFAVGDSVEWHFADSAQAAGSSTRFATQLLGTVPYALAAEHAAVVETSADLVIPDGWIEVTQGANVAETMTETLALGRESPSDKAELRLKPKDKDFVIQGASVTLHSSDAYLPFVGAYQSVTNVTIGGTDASSTAAFEMIYEAMNACILVIDVSGSFGPNIRTSFLPAAGMSCMPAGMLGVDVSGSTNTPYWIEFQRTDVQTGKYLDWLRPWLTLNTPNCKVSNGVSSRLTVPLSKGERTKVMLAFAGMTLVKMWTWKECFDAVTFSGSTATLKLGIYPVKAWEVAE